MASLENLIEKISGDAQLQANTIVENARSQAQSLVQAARDQAQEQGRTILAQGEEQAAGAAESVLSGLRFQIRNEVIQAKQKTMDAIFESVLERLRAMDKADFMRFVMSSVSAENPDGEEILLPSSYGFSDVDWLNEYLASRKLNANVTLSHERSVKSGFILTHGGVEKNNTFESLLDYYRYELENEVNQVLFGKGGATA